MTISQAQLVDILYKKLSGVSKTDTGTAKSPANEANASPQLSPGTTVWQQDYLISSVTILPASNSSAVSIYRDLLTSTVSASNLSESIVNATWATGLTDWIPPQFGAGYQVQLYAAPVNTTNPQTIGVNLPVGGSGNSDSWYFDYTAGIVNFADTNVPAAVAGNVVYVVGARYTGLKGITNFANLTIGNISIAGNTLTSNNGNIFINSNLTTSATFYGNTVGTTANYTGNVIVAALQANSVLVSGNIQSNGIIANTSATIAGINISGNTIVGNVNGLSLGNVYVGNLFYANGSPFVSSNYGNTQVLANLAANSVTNISILGNITANYFIGNAAYLVGLPTQYANANVTAFLSNFGSNSISTAGNITANYFIGNVSGTAAFFTGNVSGNTAVFSKVTATTVNANLYSYSVNSNVIYGNMYGNISIDTISPYQTSVTVFNSTTAIGIPSGSNSQYPASNVAGYLRYNNSISTLEYYNGSNWIPISNKITDQIITPDGVSQSFNLDQPTTAVGILVSINGTVQRPGVAYTVSGTTITFAEIPTTTDIVDVRYIANAVSTNLDVETVDTGNVVVGTANTIIDNFDTTQYRSAKYTISSTNPYDSQLAEILLLQNNGIVTVTVFGILNTGNNNVTYYANTYGGTANLIARGTTDSNQLRIKRIYFNI